MGAEFDSTPVDELTGRPLNSPGADAGSGDRTSGDPVQAAWADLLHEATPEHRVWLRRATPLSVHEPMLMVAVPDDFTKDRVLRTNVEAALPRFFQRASRLEIIINPELAQPVDPTPTRIDPEPSATEPQRRTPSRAATPHPTTIDSRLNPKYSFENFVIGSSNRFAHAAAVAVAEAPGKSYNPLMIYGESGLGKTHLLHALGHYVRHYYDRVRVRYVSTEELTNDFINAISENRTAEFRRRYRDVDVLLIDDIQFLEAKIQTQEEFFHTFNTLHNAQKQIVMTSDRPPKLLEALEPRLRSRFEWGLITDVQAPDLETRIAILKKKAAQERLTVSLDVLEFVASRIQSNIRELEGALIRITAFASLNRTPVTMELAMDVLKDLIPVGADAEITAQQIIQHTAQYFDFSVDDLCGSSRTSALATARQIAMYLCRELTDMSLPKIGQEFGGRDHTTVMHADRKIRQLMNERRHIYNQVTELTSRIKQRRR
ncbi:chromosomal replication initiation protein [Enemella dayhoffiae]|uniref:Chromosomal replication initiator protein DnaA n=1 Tax=Enemella dayhoffiae TaxID=2016507 RepID=A0A255HBJ7_9ACTN|nr:chromosomal replication initiation protein [Enemella dayhoffiae]